MTQVCVGADRATEVHIEAGNDDVDVVDPRVGVSSTVRFNLADADDEDCVTVDGDGAQFAAILFSLVQCKSVTLTVRDAATDTVLTSASGFCGASLQTTSTSPVKVCARSPDAPHTVGLGVNVDDDPASPTAVTKPAIPLDEGIVADIGSSADVDCFDVSHVGVEARSVGFDDNGACLNRSYSVFNASGGVIASGEDCGPRRSVVFGDGDSTICVRALSAPRVRLTAPLDPRSDLVTAHPVPFTDTITSVEAEECRRVTLPTQATYSFDTKPQDGDCAGQGRMHVYDINGGVIADVQLASSCNGITLFLDAGDVLVCADANRPATLRVLDDSARPVTSVDGECLNVFEGNQGTLSCPGSTISAISFATWGATDFVGCADQLTEQTTCSVSVENEPALTRCIGRSDCTVDASTSTFTDSCPFTFKALTVVYSCAGEPAPVHQWTFNGDTADSIGDADGELIGGATVAGGSLVPDGIDDMVRTGAMSEVLGERTLVVWVAADNLDQRGGGVFAVDDGFSFEGLAFGELSPAEWNTSSAFFQSTFGAGVGETATDRVMLAVRYSDTFGVQLLRNGVRLNTSAVSRSDYDGAHVVFGVLGDREVFNTGFDVDSFDAYFAGRIDEARVYDRVLSVEDLQAINAAGPAP